MNILDSANLSLSNLRFQTPTLPASGAAPSGKIDKNSELYKAAEDFQSIFIKQMLDTMRKTVNKTSETEQSQGEAIFEDMLYDEYAKKMSKSAGFDLADNLYRQMSFLQNLPKASAG